MGAAFGNLTYTTYYVLDEPPEGFREMFLEAVKKHAFRDIDIDGGKDRSIGWVALGEPFDTELEWAKLFVDPYVCLSLREDVIKIPKTAFQAHLERREKEHMHKLGRESLKKSERAEIKEVVLNELRKRALADIRTYDVVWNTADATIRFFSQSKGTCESFEEIIRDTWGLRLAPRAPYTVLVARTENGAEVAAQLLDIEPADFVGIEE
jgi:recombination associated protein RdgC